MEVFDNHFHIKSSQSFEVNQSYNLYINSSIKDYLGNSLDKDYILNFVCKSNFFKDVDAGETHSMATSLDGDIYTWGSLSAEENDSNLSSRDIRSIPLGLLNTKNAKDYNAGSFSSAIIDENSTLMIMGNNTLLANNDNDFKNISIGNKHNVVIKIDDTLWSWGKNNNGQLGNFGIFSQVELTQEYSKTSDWIYASAGEDYTIALKNDGTMWGWGNNEFGQIGNATYKEIRVPTQEDTNATNWKSLSAGANHSASIKEDGTLWSWGQNNSGELGDASNLSKVVATQESTASSWKSVSCGYDHTIAIKDDGTLWTWGNNFYGQLGNSSTTNSNIPIQISTDKWNSISAGDKFSLATKEDGTLWSWGYNAYEQLGLGSNVADKNIPTEIK